MRAIEIEGGAGPAEALTLVERPDPVAGLGQVVITVRAAGVNRPDVLQRMGRYPPPPGAPDVLGLEVAGVVAEIGAGVERWRVGDRVCALLPGGGYADRAVADARHVLPIPAGVDFVQAAALPETVFTVWANVFEAGGLKPGETLLVHGATGGIGVTAIQMARTHGARVIATARGADKADAARAMGADVALDASDGAEALGAALADAGGADVILDMVGAAYAAVDQAALKPFGRWVVIAVQGGARAEIDLAALMTKRAVLTGSTLRNRSADEKARLARAVEATVWPWVADGRVRPPIDRTWPLAEAAAAHARMEAGGHVGKLVLTVGPPETGQ